MVTTPSAGRKKEREEKEYIPEESSTDLWIFIPLCPFPS
jgi:hypothetical protein